MNDDINTEPPAGKFTKDSGLGMNRGTLPPDFETMSFLELKRMMRVLFHRKTRILLIMILFVTASGLHLKHAERIYETFSILELSVQRPRVAGSRGAIIEELDGVSSRDLLNTQLAKLTGQYFRRNVLEALRALPESPLPEEDNEALAALDGAVSIDFVRDTYLVKITVKHPDREFARLVADTYAEQAVSMVRDAVSMGSEAAVEWLNNKVAQAKLDLENIDKKILEFEKENVVQTLISERKTAELAMANYSRALTDAIAKRVALSSTYTANHPEVLAQDQLIASAKKAYDDEVQHSRELERKLTEVQSQLTELRREGKVIELNYQELMKRMAEARLSADENTASIRIAEPAELPFAPVSPKPVLVIAAALVSGLFVGVAVTLVTHTLRDRILAPEDVESSVGLPVLGAVPLVRRAERDKLARACLDNGEASVIESFASIRTAFESSKDCKTIVVTSCSPGEGKTFSSCNLAASLAKTGFKTLLVDVDLRLPQLMNIFSVDASAQTLDSIFIGTDPPAFETLINKTSMDGLDVVVSMPLTSINPAEVLGSSQMRRFVSWAEAHYDRIVFDVPPFFAASDAFTLGTSLDCVIFVCRSNKAVKSLLEWSVQRLRLYGGTPIGFIMNCMEHKAFQGGYKYSSSYYSYQQYGK
jgi:capsular exopolysaccharide synthesis family protein